jgi:hypothetical protein
VFLFSIPLKREEAVEAVLVEVEAVLVEVAATETEM